MDREAWHAAVAKSRKQLSDWTELIAPTEKGIELTCNSVLAAHIKKKKKKTKAELEFSYPILFSLTLHIQYIHQFYKVSLRLVPYSIAT